MICGARRQTTCDVQKSVKNGRALGLFCMNRLAFRLRLHLLKPGLGRRGFQREVGSVRLSRYAGCSRIGVEDSARPGQKEKEIEAKERAYACCCAQVEWIG